MIFITFKYRYRKQIIIGTLIFLLLGLSCFFGYKKIFHKKKENNEDKVVAKFIKKEEATSKVKKTSSTDEKIIYKVDIKGEVHNPGIYSLEANSRVIDVIELAGGLTENANTTVINLSKKISDEMVIIIYSNEQVKDFEKTQEIQKQVQEKCIGETIKNDACIENNVEEDIPKLISINTATKEELMQLTGIGEAKALDIIKYREENGPFQNIEDIKNVSGIGDSLFAKIKDSITI